MLLNDCYVLNLKGKYFNNDNNDNNGKSIEINQEININSKLDEKKENIVFLNLNKNEDNDNIEKFEEIILLSIEKNEEISEKKKDRILLDAFREELKLMNNQVNELKNKIENEINKNLCKVRILNVEMFKLNF